MLLHFCLGQMTPHWCRALCGYQATLLQSNICKTLVSCERRFWPMDLPVMESLPKPGRGNRRHQKEAADHYLMLGKVMWRGWQYREIKLCLEQLLLKDKKGKSYVYVHLSAFSFWATIQALSDSCVPVAGTAQTQGERQSWPEDLVAMTHSHPIHVRFLGSPSISVSLQLRQGLSLKHLNISALTTQPCVGKSQRNIRRARMTELSPSCSTGDFYPSHQDRDHQDTPFPPTLHHTAFLQAPSFFALAPFG